MALAKPKTIGDHPTSYDTGETAADKIDALFDSYEQLCVNVRDYGAKGDGVTDDTGAFQAAIDATGGVVSVPTGRYVLRNVSLKSGVTLRGAGSGSVLLASPSCAAGDAVFVSSSKDDWALQGIVIDGNYPTVPGDGADGVRLVDVSGDSSGFAITNCELCNNGYGAIIIRGTGSRFRISGNRIHDTDCGVITIGTLHENAVISDNVIYGGTSEGISLYAIPIGTPSNAVNKNISITGNSISGKAGGGILIRAGSSISVVGNSINGCSGGVRLDNPGWNTAVYNSDIVVQGNVIDGSTSSNGITVSGHRIVVVGNIVRNSAGSGIMLLHTTIALQDCVVANNLVTDSETDAMLAENTENLLLSGNMCVSGSGSATVGINVTGALTTGAVLRGNKSAGFATPITRDGGLASQCTLLANVPNSLDDRATVTGSRGGNVAMASLLTGLSTLGLIVDSSS